jgi:hypothetical protein
MELVSHEPGSTYGFACGSASGYTGAGNQTRHAARSEPGSHAAYQTGPWWLDSREKSWWGVGSTIGGSRVVRPNVHEQ